MALSDPRELERFYVALERLAKAHGGARRLGDCHGRLPWPQRGVYFFFEPGELRPNGKPRVVRVGTHAVSAGSGSTLWGRLKQHLGTGAAGSSGGNHRGSIFRRHVGSALLGAGRVPQCLTWGAGQSRPEGVAKASELPLEVVVSSVLAAMQVVWVDVDGEPSSSSERATIERSAIALLSGAEPPSSAWLGRHAAAPEIRRSGLWNVNYVDDPHEPRGVDLLEARSRR